MTFQHHRFVTKKTFAGIMVFEDDAFLPHSDATTKAMNEGLPTAGTNEVERDETTTQVSVESKTVARVEDFRVHFPSDWIEKFSYEVTSD